jgi:ribonuclease HI
MCWVAAKRVRTTLARDEVNEPLFQLVDEAVAWLKSNSYPNPIVKWRTERWGENPADFGRK